MPPLQELKGTQDIAEEDVKALQLDGERCVMKYGTNPLTVRYGLQIMRLGQRGWTEGALGFKKRSQRSMNPEAIPRFLGLVCPWIQARREYEPRGYTLV